MPRHAQSLPSDNTRVAPVRVAAQTAIRRKQVTLAANLDYERLKKKYPNLANESYTYLVKFDRQHEANLAKLKSYSIRLDNRNELLKRNARLAASDKLKEADEAQAYNTILRVFGASDMSTEEARANPLAVSEKMDEVKNDIADAALVLYPAARGMSWLRGTGRLGNVLYHGINGTLAAASGYDMYENGPNFWNTLGIAAPIMEYGPLFANLVGNKYALYQFGKLLNEGLNTLSTISTGRYVKPYRLSREMNLAIKISEIPSAEIPSNVGWGPRQTISVTHKSDKALPLTLYNESRWDVINENANPLGIWFLGRFGIPRSTNTGATLNKALKALKARQLFSRRPYTHSGDLTLDKPLVTVGDVPDRSLLSYKAELMGADGLIYNNVYDNGYDANQVILSFKQPDNYMLTARAYKGSPRKFSDYEFFTTPSINTTTSNKYILDGLFNLPKIKEDLLAGKQDFIDWIESPAYRAAAEANKAEAEAMGLKYVPTYEYPAYLDLKNKGVPINFVVDPNNNSAGWVPTSSGSSVTINLAKAKDIRAVNAHENAHVARHGWLDPNYPSLDVKKLQAYLRYKNSQVFLDNLADLTEEAGNMFYDFGSKGFPHEAVTNSRDLGKFYGIKVGQKYPGPEKTLELLNKMELNANPGFLKKFVQSFRRDPEHLEFVWKALNGTLWVLIPTILGTTYNMMNNNEKD